jgi:4-amino-4-deoxy-L-arabinose transferase-like glycosyltransferase
MLIARDLTSLSDVLKTTSHWPPLYPILLSLASSVFGELIHGARTLHFFLFGLNTFLFYCLVSDNFKSNDVWALGAALLFCTTPQIFSLHYMAWSESPFLTFTLLHLLFFRAWNVSGSTHTLVLSALAISLALLTRYAGAAFIGAASCIVLSRPGSYSVKISRTFSFGAVAVSPLLIYLLTRSLFDDSSSPPRRFVIHLIEPERVMKTVDVVFNWFNPLLLPTVASAVMIAAGLLLILGSFLKGSGTSGDNPTRQLIFTAVFYILFLFASISFFDFYTPIDNRTLSPIFPLIVASLVFSTRYRPQALQSLGMASTATILIWALLGAVTVLSSTSRLSRAGSGYLSEDFRAQEILQYAAKIQSPSVYSNSSETIEFYLDREAQSLPRTFDPKENQANPDSSSNYKALVAEIGGGKAILVYFNSFAWRSYFPPLGFFENEAALPVLYKGNSGVIFGKESTVISIRPD